MPYREKLMTARSFLAVAATVDCSGVTAAADSLVVEVGAGSLDAEEAVVVSLYLGQYLFQGILL
jgi:hypothetical protein